MQLKSFVRKAFRKTQNWLGEEEPSSNSRKGGGPSVAFSDSSDWIHHSFVELKEDPLCSQRPQYVWGVLQAAASAGGLGIKRITVIEFGVASGAGLVCLERIAERCEQMTGIEIEVCGFDTGKGAPRPKDYRDLPFRWSEGFYPCDREQLKKRLRKATIHYGMVGETVEGFLTTHRTRIGFAGFDLCLYSATRDALSLLAAPHDLLLPRMPCFFRSSFGKENCEFTGEQLAISEFNEAWQMRKLSRIRGLEHTIPQGVDGSWIEGGYFLHLFGHPLYEAPGSVKETAATDINGREAFVNAGSEIDLQRRA